MKKLISELRVNRELSVVKRELSIVNNFPLFTSHHSHLIIHMFTIHIFTIHISPFTSSPIHHSQFIIHNSSFTIHHSQFIIHIFTIHNSLFTIPAVLINQWCFLYKATYTLFGLLLQMQVINVMAEQWQAYLNNIK